MTRVVFLLEEYSMKVLLDGLLPRLFPGLLFLCVPHEGKQDLEKSIPHKLRGWREPDVQFCVIRDNDGADCLKVKENLVSLCERGGRNETLVRIACQELEAWYFGAPDALADAFGDEGLRNIKSKAKYRDPDTIVQPAAALTELVPEFQKVSGARALARVMSRENSSRSFQALMEGLERLCRQRNDPQGND